MTEKELTVETVLNKIKSRGHWKVIIRPTQFKKKSSKPPRMQPIYS